MQRKFGPLASLAALLLAALLLAGCGSSGDDGGGAHPDYARALRGAPAPLAALYAKGGRVLPGDAFERQLAALRGHPVVANVWASWCGPCRFEFPTLQKVAARYGKRVAFVGIDTEDDEAAARTFLREEPVPYPSYFDPDRGIARRLGARVGLPNTVFIDPQGKVVQVKIGPYSHDSELEQDLHRYALRSG